MHTVATRDSRQTLVVLEPRTQLRCESQLRVAASTLARPGGGDVNATTAIGVLGADDVSAFERTVRQIADEYGLQARVRLQVGSFAVRFSAAG